VLNDNRINGEKEWEWLPRWLELGLAVLAFSSKLRIVVSGLGKKILYIEYLNAAVLVIIKKESF
jgi:hypothetical protein